MFYDWNKAYIYTMQMGVAYGRRVEVWRQQRLWEGGYEGHEGLSYRVWAARRDVHSGV
jgi:hypothetical protein